MPPEICPPTPDALIRAAQLLRGGRLVAFPTETVYGLGADATQDRAVASIFEAKGRPRFNPLIVHVTGLDEARRYARFDPRAEGLARRFWPGGLTLVLPRTADCPLSLLVSAGLDTVAIRAPAHPVAQALLRETGRPLAAPSANRSGKLSPTQAAHVAEAFEAAADLVPLVLDGGPCALGLESTVVGLPPDGPATLLRPGAVPRAEIEQALGATLAEADPGSGAEGRASPGQLASHYAPNAPLKLNVTQPAPSDVVLAFGPQPPAGARIMRNLSARGDLREAAAHLFAFLRELDQLGGGAPIAVMPIPEDGLGEAINDRLARAAAPRGPDV